MNTVQLECFLTVAEYLNFSKASEALKLTQPAVTHQIQSLEKELDVKLFRRTSKNVSLTQEGYLFLADAQLILKTAISARERLGNHEHFLPLELGCHNQAELRLLPPVLHDLYEEYPLLRPNIRLIPLPSLMNMLENNQIDAALGLRENRKKSSLYYKELCMARYACICAPEHPAARYDSPYHRTALRSRKLYRLHTASGSRLFFQCAESPAVQSSPGQPLSHRQHGQRPRSCQSADRLHHLSGYPAARDRDLRYIPITDLPAASLRRLLSAGSRSAVLKRFLALMGESLSLPPLPDAT